MAYCVVLSCVVCSVCGGVRSPRDATAAGDQKVALVSTSAAISDSLIGGLVENEWETCFAAAPLMVVTRDVQLAIERFIFARTQ